MLVNSTYSTTKHISFTEESVCDFDILEPSSSDEFLISRNIFYGKIKTYAILCNKFVPFTIKS